MRKKQHTENTKLITSRSRGGWWWRCWCCCCWKMRRWICNKASRQPNRVDRNRARMRIKCECTRIITQRCIMHTITASRFCCYAVLGCALLSCFVLCHSFTFSTQRFFFASFACFTTPPASMLCIFKSRLHATISLSSFYHEQRISSRLAAIRCIARGENVETIGVEIN